MFLVNMVTGVFAHRSVAEEYNQEREKLCKMLKITALHVVNKKGQITDWSCSETPSLTNPLRKRQLQTGAVLLRHLAL